VVQTPAMKRAATDWYAAPLLSGLPSVKVVPFVDAMPRPHERAGLQPEWDFLYVADGQAHKNHRVLLVAWQLLASEGLRPSLALTLGPNDDTLLHEVENACEKHDLRIRNLGHIPRDEVMALYAKVRAMIFPSTSESFGLPLIEAAHMGVPILASELDYVRDVCNPMHTFDPTSAVSVARAVKRFLGSPEPIVDLRTPAEFWNELLQEG
jgi:glycosyltransferase involved in cell wall biosynthesis